MIKGNKGEWSEVYALFKVLGDKVLQSGDENLNKIKNLYYPIIKVLRKELNENYEYVINKDLVCIVSDGTELLRVKTSEFLKNANALLGEIKNNSGSFEILNTEEFMNKVHCKHIKAKSSDKSDIMIMIHDNKTGQTPVLGFSIKSQIGGSSTLLNAGKTTNFIYKIVNKKLSSSEIEHINSINTKSKIKDRMLYLKNLGAGFEFKNTENMKFYNNLVLIDSMLPIIISEILLDFYSTGYSETTELLDEIEKRNPVEYDKSYGHDFYHYKVKKMLTDAALGMMPGTVWTGEYNATGGYLLVREDGEVLCYHMYNRNEFENYLINNTKLETPSSSRHDFGYVYNECDKQFIKLNLQIRFLK